MSDPDTNFPPEMNDEPPDPTQVMTTYADGR